MSEVIRVGLLGCGVVGSGVVEVLTDHRERLESSFGKPVEITHIAVKDQSKRRPAHIPKEKLCGDWQQVCSSPDVDVIIEVMGGKTAAGKAVEVALRNGKHVITANKELLASNGAALNELAQEKGVRLECEASVLGGIPALHLLGTYFRMNRIRKLRGIVNGTSNYVLSRMTEAGTEFADALAEAQTLGYAEPDPTMDVEGYDALFKLKILLKYANRVVHSSQQPDPLPVGISTITQEQIQAAATSGKKIKHLVQASWDSAGTLEKVGVGPALVDADDPLYHVDGVQNALSVVGDVVGEILITGPGAGALPTASAIVEDLAKIYEVPVNLQQGRTAVAF